MTAPAFPPTSSWRPREASRPSPMNPASTAPSAFAGRATNASVRRSPPSPTTRATPRPGRRRSTPPHVGGAAIIPTRSAGWPERGLATRDRADERLARHADADRPSELVEPTEPGQHPRVPLVPGYPLVTEEADARIDDDPLFRDSRRPRSAERRPQQPHHVLDRIYGGPGAGSLDHAGGVRRTRRGWAPPRRCDFRIRRGRNGSRRPRPGPPRPPAIRRGHQDDARVVLRDERGDGGVAEAGDVVDHARARLERRAGGRRARGVRGDRDRELAREQLDRPDEAVGPFRPGERPGGGGGGRGGADVDQRRARLHHPERGAEEVVVTGVDRPRVEGFGTQVHDAHGDDGQAIADADASESGSTRGQIGPSDATPGPQLPGRAGYRSEEHTSELQSRLHLVCRLLLEKKKKKRKRTTRSSKQMQY